MSYYEDVYKKRVAFHGKDKKQIIGQLAERQFLENLAESPNTEDLVIEGIYTKGIILTNKSDQKKLTMELFTVNDLPIQPGDIVKWGEEDWLVFTVDKFSIPAYTKSDIFQSNIWVKYYDENDKLIETPGYFLGSLDSVLREAIYRQMGMAIQLDDRRGMLVLPKKIIRNNSRIMLDKRVWRVIDYDSTSNKNLVYISLQEDNFDAARDDLENGIADAFVRPVWEIIYSIPTIEIGVGETFLVEPQFFKSNIPNTTVAWHLVGENDFFSIDGQRVTGVSAGEAILTIVLEVEPEVTKTISVKVTAEEPEADVFEFVGDAVIHTNDSATYQLFENTSDGKRLPRAATFTLLGEDGQQTTLAQLKRNNSVSYSILTGSSPGRVILRAVYNEIVREKTIEIRSVW